MAPWLLGERCLSSRLIRHVKSCVKGKLWAPLIKLMPTHQKLTLNMSSGSQWNECVRASWDDEMKVNLYPGSQWSRSWEGSYFQLEFVSFPLFRGKKRERQTEWIIRKLWELSVKERICSLFFTQGLWYTLYFLTILTKTSCYIMYII